jgi:hypothetical protein
MPWSCTTPRPNISTPDDLRRRRPVSVSWTSPARSFRSGIAPYTVVSDPGRIPLMTDSGGPGHEAARCDGDHRCCRFEEKAGRCHPRVVKVSRWLPSSQMCSACGFNSGKTSLDVGSWTCPSCGIGRDRDLNAAENIRVLGLRVAAGLAETENARGGSRGPGRVLAAADEARTHRGVT